METASNTRNAIPSRYANPFATCWTRPGALPFFFPNGDSAEFLVARLAALGYRGQILGPHGSGKSTLLAALRPLLAAAGRPIQIVDGFEERSLPARWKIRATSRVFGRGLLVTAHHPVGLPTLIELRPDTALVREIVSKLQANTPSPICDADIEDSIARRGVNVREVLFDLFNRHESLVRGVR
jgi:hypothetical protein